MACFWVNLVAVSENCGGGDQPLDFIIRKPPNLGGGGILFIYANPDLYDERYYPQYPELAGVGVGEITGYYTPSPLSWVETSYTSSPLVEGDEVSLEGSTLTPITPIALDRTTAPDLDFLRVLDSALIAAGIEYGWHVVTISFDGGPEQLAALHNSEGA